MTNPVPDEPPFWAHIMLFYPSGVEEQDRANRRRACDDALKRLQRLRPEGTAIANMRGFMSGGIEAPHEPVPLTVAVSSSNDISFELALEESIQAIVDSGKLWALTVNLGGEEITEASAKALSLIQEMMNENRIRRAPVRHRDAVATEAASSDSETRWGHDGSWWDHDG